MLKTELKPQLFAIFSAIKRKLHANALTFSSRTVNADSTTANPLLRIQADEDKSKKIVELCKNDPEFKDYLQVEIEKNVVLIKWKESAASDTFLQKYTELPASNEPNNQPPLPVVNPEEILQVFKKFVKSCNGINGVHFARIVVDTSRKNYGPLITIYNSTNIQSERTGFFLMNLNLEPIWCSPKTKNVISFKIPESTDFMNINNIDYLKQFFPERDSVFQEIEDERKKAESPVLSTVNTSTPHEESPAVSTPKDEKETTLKVNHGTEVYHALGTLYSNLSKEDQLSFIQQYASHAIPDQSKIREEIRKEVINEITPGIKNEARKELVGTVSKHLSGNYAVVRVNDAVQIKTDKDGNIGFTVKTIPVSSFLG